MTAHSAMIRANSNSNCPLSARPNNIDGTVTKVPSTYLNTNKHHLKIFPNNRHPILSAGVTSLAQTFTGLTGRHTLFLDLNWDQP